VIRAACALVFVAGCGGNDCTATFSGNPTITGSYDCKAIYQEALIIGSNIFGVSVVGSDHFSLQGSVTDKLATGERSVDVHVTQPDGSILYQAGSASYTLTSKDVSSSTSYAKNYTVHGIADVILADPVGGAAGGVHFDF
jgi:hypothetical protein